MEEKNRICIKSRYSESGEVCFEDNHDLGVAIATAHKWEGKEIAKTFSESLEDANFHTENAMVRRIFGLDKENIQGGFSK